MAARSPRRSFATPFVVTLAAAPAACYVQTAPAPAYQGAPQQPAPQPQPQEAPGPTQGSHGPVVSNPPRPMPAPEQQSPPTTPPKGPIVSNPPRPQDPPPPQQNPQPPTTRGDIAWTVFKSGDGCSAAIKVECQPKATCNPPPPFKTTCPADVSLDKPVTVRSQDNGATCMLEFAMPDCPKGVACNPPRPRKVECPTRK